MNNGFTEPPVGNRINTNHPQAQGLIACWRLNNFNNVNAASRHPSDFELLTGNKAYTESGTPTITQLNSKRGFYLRGSGAGIRGQNDKMNFYDLPVGSVSAWIFLTSNAATNAYNGICTKRNGDGLTNFGWSTGVGNGATASPNNDILTMNMCDGATSVAKNHTTVMSLNTWHHCVFTWNRDIEWTITLNNIRQSFTTGLVVPQSLGSAIHVPIGVRYVATGRLNGFIKDVMLYNRALTQTDVTQLYVAPYSMYQRSKIGFNEIVAPAYTRKLLSMLGVG